MTDAVTEIKDRAREIKTVLTTPDDSWLFIRGWAQAAYGLTSKESTVILEQPPRPVPPEDAAKRQEHIAYLQENGFPNLEYAEKVYDYIEAGIDKACEQEAIHERFSEHGKIEDRGQLMESVLQRIERQGAQAKAKSGR